MTYKNDIISLEKFIQNIYLGNDLSIDEAIKNLEDGLMEIKFEDNFHASNALAITNNGYALTSFHCVSGYKNKIITDSLNNNYKIERICQYNKQKELALIKTTQNKANTSKIYKIKNINTLLNEYPLGYLIEHKSIWNGEIKNKNYKFMITNSKNKNEYIVNDHILAKIPIISGDSGGIMLDYTGKLIGFASASNKKISGYSTIFTGFDLIQKEINLLKNPLKRIIRKLF